MTVKICNEFASLFKFHRNRNKAPCCFPFCDGCANPGIAAVRVHVLDVRYEVCEAFLSVFASSAMQR